MCKNKSIAYRIDTGISTKTVYDRRNINEWWICVNDISQILIRGGSKFRFKRRAVFTRRRCKNRRRWGKCLIQRRRALTFKPTIFLSKRVRTSALVSFQLAWLVKVPRLWRRVKRQRSICVYICRLQLGVRVKVFRA